MEMSTDISIPQNSSPQTISAAKKSRLPRLVHSTADLERLEQKSKKRHTSSNHRPNKPASKPLLENSEFSSEETSEDDIFTDEDASQNEKNDIVVDMSDRIEGGFGSKSIFEKTQLERAKEAAKSKFWGPFLVAGMVTGMGFLYLSAWMIFVRPFLHYWFGSIFGLLNFFFGHFLAVCLSLNYFYTVKTNPGTEWDFTPSASAEKLEQVKNDISVTKLWTRDRYHKKIRYCFHCQKFQAPRSHHCRVCQKCVLRMDHHCPWSNNCVGLGNHKYFLGFLFYSALAIVYLAIGLIMALIFAKPGTFGLLNVLLLIGSVALMIFFSGLVGGQLPNGIYLASKNLTKIELWQAHWAEYDSKKKGLSYTYPYDKGSWRKNLDDFLGTWWFFLPAASAEHSNGLQYPNLVPWDD